MSESRSPPLKRRCISTIYTTFEVCDNDLVEAHIFVDDMQEHLTKTLFASRYLCDAMDALACVTESTAARELVTLLDTSRLKTLFRHYHGLDEIPRGDTVAQRVDELLELHGKLKRAWNSFEVVVKEDGMDHIMNRKLLEDSNGVRAASVALNDTRQAAVCCCASLIASIRLMPAVKNRMFATFIATENCNVCGFSMDIQDEHNPVLRFECDHGRHEYCVIPVDKSIAEQEPPECHFCIKYTKRERPPMRVTHSRYSDLDAIEILLSDDE